MAIQVEDILDLLFSKKDKHMTEFQHMTAGKTEFDLALEEVKKFFGEEAPLPKVLETLSNTLDAVVDDKAEAEADDVDHAVELYLDNNLEDKVNDITEKYLQDNLDDALKDSDFGVNDRVGDAVKEYLDDNLGDAVKEVLGDNEDDDLGSKIETAVEEYCSEHLEDLVKDNIGTDVIESAVTAALEEDSEIVDNAVASYFTSRKSSNNLNRAIENYLDNQDDLMNEAIDGRLGGIVTDKLTSDPAWLESLIDEAIERAISKKRTNATTFLKDQLAAALGHDTVTSVEAKLFEVLDARLEKVVNARIAALNLDELIVRAVTERVVEVKDKAVGLLKSWLG